MNIDHIEAFMYVVHFNSIHKAADALFLSQPTVTARIKTLERELDTDLFYRQGRGLILTEKGREFLPFAEEIIHTFQQGKKQLKKESIHEEVTIGANSITSQYFIPFVLPLLKKAHPYLRFKLISAPNDVLVDKLLQNQVDLAFMKDVDHSRLQKYEILDNSVRLVIYPDHPFHSQSEITAKQLALEPMVFFECGAFDWNQVRKIFEVSQIEPRIEFQVDQLEVAKSLILSGNAIGFLPYLCIKNELEQGTLIEVEVSNLIKIKQSIYLIHVNNGSGQPLFLREILQSINKFEKDCLALTLHSD